MEVIPEGWWQGNGPTINAPKYRIRVGGYLNTNYIFLDERGRFRGVMKNRRGWTAEAFKIHGPLFFFDK